MVVSVEGSFHFVCCKGYDYVRCCFLFVVVGFVWLSFCCELVVPQFEVFELGDGMYHVVLCAV